MDKRTVLVTGGTRGIGKAIVLKFASLNYNIISCGRNEKLLTELQDELSAQGVDHYVARCDLRNKEAIHTFFTNAMEKFDGVDVVVNNAGVFHPGEIENEPDEMFEVMMETNLNATYHFSKLSIPYLKKSPLGHLFNICSTASITPYKN
ncbi:MAG: NAD(P)-dependent dehydrogenase (short-subunit alcohol dehydrogenase family), partial [Bacteroidia bacterium]